MFFQIFSLWCTLFTPFCPTSAVERWTSSSSPYNLLPKGFILRSRQVSIEMATFYFPPLPHFCVCSRVHTCTCTYTCFGSFCVHIGWKWRSEENIKLSVPFSSLFPQENTWQFDFFHVISIASLLRKELPQTPQTGTQMSSWRNFLCLVL